MNCVAQGRWRQPAGIQQYILKKTPDRGQAFLPGEENWRGQKLAGGTDICPVRQYKPQLIEGYAPDPFRRFQFGDIYAQRLIILFQLGCGFFHFNQLVTGLREVVIQRDDNHRYGQNQNEEGEEFSPQSGVGSRRKRNSRFFGRFRQRNDYPFSLMLRKHMYWSPSFGKVSAASAGENRSFD
jgi:hypothetical protein